MTIDEINKEIENCQKQLDEADKEFEAYIEKKEKIFDRIEELEREKRRLRNITFEDETYYFKFGEEDYHYNIFEAIYIRESKRDPDLKIVKYFRFREDDRELSFYSDVKGKYDDAGIDDKWPDFYKIEDRNIPESLIWCGATLNKKDVLEMKKEVEKLMEEDSDE